MLPHQHRQPVCLSRLPIAPTASPGLDRIDQAPDDRALIGLIIEYQELRRSKIERRIQGSSLSQQEQKICLALADDLTHTAIAAQLLSAPIPS